MEKEEPKTLNDLYVTLEDITKKRVVRVDELKAEAVKWVKGYKNRNLQTDVLIKWIEYFFNLKEEDLA